MGLLEVVLGARDEPYAPQERQAVKRTCCRSLPRCGDCPVRVAARDRRFTRPTPASLVEEVLAGRAPRPLPPAVVRALATIDAADPQSRPTT